jgi:hypothetical protein
MVSLMFWCDEFGASRDDMLFLIYLIGTVLCCAAIECFLGIVGLPGIRHLTEIAWEAKTTPITGCVSAESKFYTKPAEVAPSTQWQFVVSALARRIGMSTSGEIDVVLDAVIIDC